MTDFLTENELLLKNFRPISTLKAKRTPVCKPKFPVIDMHNHLTSIYYMTRNTSPKEYVDIMDASGVAAIINLNGGWDNLLKENIEKFDRSFPGRFLTFCNFNYDLIDTPDFDSHVKATVSECARLGGRGIKIFKELGLKYRDKAGKLIMPDDPRLKVIWEAAAKAKIPVLYHIADPLAFFQPPDGKNERIE
ncbi:MAG: hypothetical protein FWD78_17055 [Treponema sp.]|nr:hypothetical protein [Treponema sp.]